MDLPDLTRLDRVALFLDFDGTLVAIADRPDTVAFDAATRDVLTRLQGALSGALAIVTGRDIATIDNYVTPLRLPIAGVHGLIRRDAEGRLHSPPIDMRQFDAVADRLKPLIERHPALLVERKFGAVALHYRAAPAFERDCIAAIERAVAGLAAIEIKRGKLVVEVRAAAGDKGSAIADFLAEPPFHGRRAVFAGDDVTDEDAFALVNGRNGVSIKIGAGETRATFRAKGTAEFIAWLDMLAGRLGG
jgi:trehalose 6-phosphate phosphatase